MCFLVWRKPLFVRKFFTLTIFCKFQLCMGRGEGEVQKISKRMPYFKREPRNDRKIWILQYCPKDFCPGLWLLRVLMMFSRVFLLAVCDPSPYNFDGQVRKNPQPILTTSTNSTKALERCEEKHVRLLIASHMKFKDESGKSHITQQSIRSHFWFGRAPFSIGYSEWSWTGWSSIMESTLSLSRRRF